MSYTVESLVSVNPGYHHEHRISLADVEKANRIVKAIEASRNPEVPQPGDIVQYTTKHGQYFGDAHIEGHNGGDRLSVCEQPYVPWVFVEDGRVTTDTSGGAWTAIPASLERVGTAQKAFKTWGHCGPCGNGAVYVTAQVNVWRYTEGSPEFSTEHHDMYYVTHLDEPRNGYTVIVLKGYTMPHTAFRTDEECRRWLESIGGIERPAAWPNSRIVWVKKP